MADEKKKKGKKSWFKDFRSELKKVTWQTPKQLAKNTAAVITLVLIVAVIVFALDVVFRALNENGVERLKSFIQSNDTVQTENTTSENVTTDNVIVDTENLIEEQSTETTDNTEESTKTEENNVEEE